MVPFCFSVFQDQYQDHGDSLRPYVTIVAEAVRSDKKEQGYKFSMYMKHDRYKAQMKIVGSELARTKWRACLDSVVQPYNLQVKNKTFF